jgi:choline dehydrogenase-like flavoprotein
MTTWCASRADIATTSVGTTKMGQRRSDGVVNRLAVRDVAGLRVVDAGRDAADHFRQHQRADADDRRRPRSGSLPTRSGR